MTKPINTREIVLDILMEILEKGGYSHVILGQALAKYQYLEKQDRAFISRVVEGTLEYLIQIDFILDQCSKVKVKKMKPVIRNLLRMSVYQIMYMDRVPDSAVCNEAVKLAVKRRFAGLKGFVNGVLRTVARQKDSFVFEEWSVKYSVPEWMIQLWRGSYPDETVERMLKAFLEESRMLVRCNTELADQKTIVKSLEEQGVRVTAERGSEVMLCLEHYDYLEGLSAFRKGWIQVQDLASSLVGELASPLPGDFILDVCGAPGGKALHLADCLKGTGMVEVRDVSPQKVSLIEENIERTGFANIRAKVWDARKLDETMVEQADLVIADLPCSGLGILGKKQDIKYHMSQEKIQALVLLQREILSVVWRYVKPGGKLIYSTCTVNSEENTEQARWFLDQFPFEPVNIEGTLDPVFELETMKDGYLQLLPGIHPCDGFFIAVFRKKKESNS